MKNHSKCLKFEILGATDNGKELPAIATKDFGIECPPKINYLWATPIKMMEPSSCFGMTSTTSLSSWISAGSTIMPTTSINKPPSKEDSLTISNCKP